MALFIICTKKFFLRYNLPGKQPAKEGFTELKLVFTHIFFRHPWLSVDLCLVND